MIPEFKFKKKTTFQKKLEIKELLKDKRIRIAGAAVASAAVLGLVVLAIPEAEAEKKQSVTALFETAGVTTEIDTVEQHFQKQIEESVSLSRNNSGTMTGSTLASAGFDVNAVSGESVEDEIAAEEASAAMVASGQAASPEAVEEAAEPVHPQLVGFSNPGIAQVEQYVNIRTKPDESATICGKLANNAACEILSETDGWYEVITNGVEGYIKSEFLVTGEAAWELADQLKIAYVRVLTETLYVREQPTTDSTIVGLASLDLKMDLVRDCGDWLEVRFREQDVQGYINKSYIAIEYTLPKGEAVETKKTDKASGSSSKSKSSSTKAAKDCSSVVEYALQFVGNPYVYGGTSLTKGTDCSGFTMSVYAKFGVYLPHSSSAQASCGTKVSASELAPGDLIFYGKGGSINHVALYIGGGKVVHASTEKTGIKVSNAFYRTPVTIRRVR